MGQDESIRCMFRSIQCPYFNKRLCRRVHARGPGPTALDGFCCNGCLICVRGSVLFTAENVRKPWPALMSHTGHTSTTFLHRWCSKETVPIGTGKPQQSFTRHKLGVTWGVCALPRSALTLEVWTAPSRTPPLLDKGVTSQLMPCLLPPAGYRTTSSRTAARCWSATPQMRSRCKTLALQERV